MASEQAVTTVSTWGLTSLDEALGWVLRKADGDLKGTNITRVELTQVLSSSNPDEDWQVRWTAAITSSNTQGSNEG